MKKIIQLLSIFGLMALINTSCYASQEHLSSHTFKNIQNALMQNTDELITQRTAIDTFKHNPTASIEQKESLEQIFNQNFQNASTYQRSMYRIKRPFQFMHTKITNPHASYLERFAYGSAAALGAAATGYAMYHGGKYVYSALPSWQTKTFIPATMNIPTELRDKIPLASPEEIQKRLKNLDIYPLIAQDIAQEIGGKYVDSEDIINIVEAILNKHKKYIEQYEDPIEHSLELAKFRFADQHIIGAILEDYSSVKTIALEFLNKVKNANLKASLKKWY